MSTRLNAEEIEATRTEKFLAVVLAAFLLVGTGWFYAKTTDWVSTTVPARTASETYLYEAREQAQRATWFAEERLRRAEGELSEAREEYNTAMNDGENIPETRRAYRAAQAELATRKQAVQSARTAGQEAAAAALPTEQTFKARVRAVVNRNSWVVAGTRFGFLVAWLLGAFQLIQVLRRRESRYQPLGLSVAATGVIMSLAFAIDYVTDYIDVLEFGPIVLSIFGVGVTLVAFMTLQRYLGRRVPGRRVRKSECPFCGYPVRGAGPHCEGCGREVVATCSTCEGPRRVGSSHCIACGVA